MPMFRVHLTRLGNAVEEQKQEVDAQKPVVANEPTVSQSSDAVGNQEPVAESKTNDLGSESCNPDTNSDAEEATPQTEITTPPAAASFCPMCGAPLKSEMPFCGNCGAKVGESPTTVSPNKQRSSLPIKKIAIGVVALMALIFVFAIIVPAVTATPDDLIKQGKYEDAYNKASDEEKTDVLQKIVEAGQFQIAYDIAPDEEKPDVLKKTMEAGQFQIAYDIAPDEEKTSVLVTNLATVVSNDLINNLKDPSSFDLREIYFDEGAHELILKVSGNNSYGGKVSNWYDYRYEKDDNEYQLYLSVSDLEDEKVYKYADDFDEKLEKYLKNATRETMRNIIADKGKAIDSDYVDSINVLFQSGQMSNVSLIEPITSIYPSQMTA